jgi:hypothetical protein
VDQEEAEWNMNVYKGRIERQIERDPRKRRRVQ